MDPMKIVQEALEKASAGLTMPSEANASFAFVAGTGVVSGPITAALIRAQLGAQHDALIGRVVTGEGGKLADKTEVEVRAAQEFFEHFAAAADPNDAWSVERAKRLTALLEVLSSELSGLVVVRFGAVTISTFLVGRTSDGHLAGLLTAQVET